MRKTINGFTIIEMLVVVSIIGILTTIAVVSYTSIQDGVRDANRSSQATIIADALESYYEKNGEYPSCNAMSDTPDNVVSNTLNGIDPSVFTAPSQTDGTNSILPLCSDITSETANNFSYLGDGSSECITTSCQEYTLSYYESASDSFKSIKSRRSPTLIVSNPGTPVVTLTMNGTTLEASIDVLTCSGGGNIMYSFRNRVNDGVWSDYSAWSADRTASRSVADNTKYGYQAMARCYISDTQYSSAVTGTESTYTYYNYDALPIASSISGYWITAPTGYLLEDGSAVSRTTYADLFTAIGTTYGSGDGSTTFNLPNSMGKATVNKNSNDTEFDTVGETYGEKAHTLIGSENGEKGHNHTQNAHSHTTSSQKWYGNRWAPNYASSGPGTDVTIGHTASSINNTTAVNQAVSDANASLSHNEIQPSIVKMYAIKWRPATGSNSRLSAGTSIQGYYTGIPTGYLAEDGTAVSRTTYADLFAAIGTTYGSGDGSTTFNLPDSRGRVVVNQNPSDAEFATLGQKYGEKTHLLTSSESGEKGHNHTQNAHTHTHNLQKWYGIRWDTTWTGTVIGADVTIGHNAASIGSTTATNQAVAASNASTAHNNIQPSIVKLSVIKYTPAVVSAEDNTAKGTSISGYWSTIPNGYLLEDGTAVSRTTYADLFAVIGTTYGVGNGSTTFNLPDSRGRVAVNKNSSDSEFDTIGEKFGEKTHLNTGAESGLKGHNHLQDPHGHTTTGQRWYGTRWANSWASSGPGTDVTIGFNDATIDDQTATNQAVAASSAASAHNNIQPSIVEMFAIKY